MLLSTDSDQMLNRILTISLLLLFLNMEAFALQTHGDAKKDDYQRGMELIEEGRFTEAIDLWIKTKHSLKEQGTGDFRIGVAAVELVTREGLTRFYPVANQFYLQGLEMDEIASVKEHIAREVEMLRPIISEASYNEWRNLLNNNDPAILSRIRGFFERVNPIRTTAINERLFEHWERIEHARRNFTFNSDTVYGTDDRGLIYVKYGEPTRIESGFFNLSVSHIHSVVTETIRQQEEARDIDPGFNNELQTTSFTGWLSDELFQRELARVITDNVFMQRISAEYEIWVYDLKMYNLRRNATFMFGINAQTKRYGLQESPEAFIPISAFRQREMRLGTYRFNVGPVIQLTMYNDLKFVDDSFMDIYYDFYDRLMSDQSVITESSSAYLYYRYADELSAIRAAAPENTSDYDRILSEIPISVRQFRFLDDGMNPYDLVFTYSYPHTEVLNDYNYFIEAYSEKEPEYHLRHSLIQYDENWNQLAQSHDFPYIIFESDPTGNGFVASSSSFIMPLGRAENSYLFSSTLYNDAYDATQPQRRPTTRIPIQILGESSREITPQSASNPLNAEALEISDVILGYITEDDPSLYEQVMIPFHVPDENILLQDAPLNVFFELYNLDLLGSEGMNEYSLEYSIRGAPGGGLFSRLFRRRGARDAAVILNFETRQNTSRHHIEIETTGYPKGDYLLKIALMDSEGTRKIERDIPFSIVE